MVNVAQEDHVVNKVHKESKVGKDLWAIKENPVSTVFPVSPVSKVKEVLKD